MRSFRYTSLYKCSRWGSAIFFFFVDLYRIFTFLYVIYSRVQWPHILRLTAHGRFISLRLTCRRAAQMKRTVVQWGMLQRIVFINKIRMLQWTQMLQRTQRNTIGRRSTRVRMTCKERLFMLLMCVRLFMLLIRESLFIVFTKERLFMLFKFTCTMYKN